MKQFGGFSQLGYIGSICILLILAAQLLPFSGSQCKDQDIRQNSTINLADTTMAETPPAVSAAAMAYDSESDRIVLFGGLISSDFYDFFSDETWSYDFNTNTWTNMTPSISPPPEDGYRMVYDSQSDLCILFGLSEAGGMYRLSGFWTYDLNSNTWTEIFTEMHWPCIMDCPGYGMVYDSKADLVILVVSGETWTYDVDTNTWENQTAADRLPPYYYLEMAYDENPGLTLLYSSDETYEFHDMWVYDSTSDAWTQMHLEREPGGPAAVAFDSRADRMILFTSLISPHFEISETWSYDFETDEWSARSPSIQPTPRHQSCIAYDSESDRTILFSGSNGFADTWAYSYEDDTWTNMAWGPDDEVFCFVVYGDSEGGVPARPVSPIHNDIVNLYIGHDPEFVLHTGDMVRWGNLPFRWDAFNMSISNLRGLNVPLYGSPGDFDQSINMSDVSDLDLSFYMDFFNYSDIVDTPGETELYYSFDLNGIHFISLNTVDEWTGSNYTCPAAQKAWLEADLAAGYEFIIVFFHYPAWSIHTDQPSIDRIQVESIRDAFHTIFLEHGVDLVFSGHDSLYYRTIRDGICYVVTGGGGANLDEIQTAGTDWRTGDIGFSEHHYCVAKAANGTLNVEILLLNGTIADAFSLGIPVSPDATFVVIISSATVVAVIAIVILVLRKSEEG